MKTIRHIFSETFPFLAALVLYATLFAGFVSYVQAAVVTPAFPASLNLFTEGEVIEEEDWNAIEIRIGETSTTTRTTLTFQVNDLMASTTLSQITTLLGLTSTGALNAGSITSGFGSINLGNDIFTTTGLGTFGNLLSNASSTLQNFTFVNATGTSATTTNMFSGTASSTSLFSTSGNIGSLTVQSCTGCAGTPGGSDTQVQFNDSSAFDGDAGFVYSKTLDRATLVNLITTSSTSTSATSTNHFSTTASSTSLFASVANFGSSVLATIANTLTGLGIWDLSGATSLAIPSGASFSATKAGQPYYDTTSGNLTVSTSTVSTSNVLLGGATTTLYSLAIASTSPDFLSGGVIEFPAHFLPQVVTAIICKADAGTSIVINLSSIAGSSDTNAVTCTTTSTQFAITANAAYAAYAAPRLEIGTVTGVVDRLSIRVIGYRTSD